MTTTKGLRGKIPAVVHRLILVVIGIATGIAAITLVVLCFEAGMFIALPIAIPFLLVGSGKLLLVPGKQHPEQVVWKRTLGLSIWSGIFLGLVMLGVMLYTSFDTRYAPGYSEEAFQSIQVGDMKDEVLMSLGEPLRVLGVNGEVLSYSDSPSGSNYLMRDVVLDTTKSRVIEIRRDIWWD